ncbi:hypothetical protein OG401_35875 [Kitasatospora purpeofusca]|uniref:hypothetical protein n=1 Tax=Kitasatospora purpeofusca TaxID=67352 RepID=UPI00224F6AF2|nr:hypothetical protein [Kitasatospora purpeofusca]MCX4689611.1 hypothetical protein [Kitasatospora purpeofusca]
MSDFGNPQPGAGRLPEATAQPFSRSRRLPPYRGIVAVDAKGFTGHPAIEHGEISRAIPELLEKSFVRADLAEVWDDRRFPASTGDGYVFGCDPEWMPFVIHPWLNILQETLEEFQLHTSGTVGMRLRVGLNIGPLPDRGRDFDGNGTARNDTHRLLDSRPVKDALATSSASVTHVAAILSDRCYQDAVLGGYTGRHPDHFREVSATVEGKPFEQRAWLFVPSPSGDLLGNRAAGDERAEPAPPGVDREAAAAPPARSGRPTVQRADRGNVNSGTVHGGQNVTNVLSGPVSGGVVQGGSVRGIGSVGGDYIEGNKGDTVHGDKNEYRR